MVSEFLTTEEFARKLRIGRSTLFEWLQQGVLKPGRDFIKVGRVLRFVWSDDTVASLAEATVQPKLSDRRKHQASTKAGINWDY